MADRSFHRTETQGVRHVEYNCTITLASGVPVFVEGDSADEASGSYMTLADTTTGVITVTTTNPFLGSVCCTATRGMGTPTTNAGVTLGLPTQDATTKKWSIAIHTWTNSAGTHSAADMTDGDHLNLHWVLRNSAVLP